MPRNGKRSQGKKEVRSRNGCTNCRARRVKCDEQRPSCSRCLIYKSAVQCSYLCVTENTNKVVGWVYADPKGDIRTRAVNDGLLTALSTSHPDPLGYFAIPAHDFHAYELLRHMLHPFDGSTGDARKAVVHELNRNFFLESVKMHRGGISAVLALADADCTPEEGKVAASEEFQRRSAGVAMAELRIELQNPNALDYELTLRMITQLFWLSAALNEDTAAQSHLTALAAIFRRRGPATQTLPLPYPGIHSKSSGWRLDRATGVMEVPGYMRPETGPLGCVTCTQEGTNVAGIRMLCDAGLVCRAMVTLASCMEYLGQLYHRPQPLSESQALDMTRYLYIVNWTYLEGFQPGSELEGIVYLALYKSSFPMDNCRVEGRLQGRVHSVLAMVRRARRILEDSWRPASKVATLSEPQFTSFVVWLVMVIGQHVVERLDRDWIAAQLRRIIGIWSKLSGGPTDFDAVINHVSGMFPWNPVRCTRDAKSFWDYSFDVLQDNCSCSEAIA